MASWFEHVTGLDERTWLRRDRSELLVRGAPVDGDARFGPLDHGAKAWCVEPLAALGVEPGL